MRLTEVKGINRRPVPSFCVRPHTFALALPHGRAVYEEVYDPASAHADEDGFRTDVMGAPRKLDMTAMRCPGGNSAPMSS